MNNQFYPEPTYPFPTYQENFQRCCCSSQTFACNDCYFYSEEHDMGATIPYCNYLHKIL